MKELDYDLVVVGAGPAGTTLAGLVKKHRPSARVLIVEKANFPRHHIGESLLPGMIAVLKELGVWKKIDEAGFPKKFGAVFVWGEDRKPWDADFNNLNWEMLEKHGRMLDAEFSWQVLRSRYDQILLDHAVEGGVECWQGTRAVKALEKGGRIVGLEVEKPGGKRVTLRCRTLADCSGQAAFLSQLRGTRRYREDLKNVAAYAYFRGARWKFEFQGHPDKTKIFICSVPEGWFWYIPVERDLVSVGLVSKASEVRRRGVKDMRAYFFEALSRCEEIRPLLKDAAVERGVAPDEPERDFFTAGDWSYANERACGPGWLAAGDAAFFLDPLLSSGVMMAHLSGHRAAYTTLAAWERPGARMEAALWKDFDRFCKEIADSFLTLVQYWYSHDPNARKWWAQARAALQAQSSLELDDKLAFVAVAAGLTYYFEREYTTQSLVFGSAGVEHSWQWEGTKLELRQWTRQILAIVETGFLKRGKRTPKLRAAEERVSWKEIPDSWIPRWLLKPRWSTAFLPTSGEGTLHPIARLDVRRGKTRTAADPKRLLPRSLALAARAIDGRRTVGDIKALLRARTDLPADLVEGQAFRLLKDLAVLGAIELGEGKGRAARKAAADPLREGEDALRRGKPALAEPALARAIAHGRGGAWALALRGEALRHLGRLPEALASLDAAVARLEPAPAGSAGLTSAQDAFAARVERGWVEDRVRVLRAKARLASGDAAGAREDAEAALRLNPRQSEALVIAAKASVMLGDAEGARRRLDAALAIEAGAKGEG